MSTESIPSFPDFRNITVHDKQVFDAFILKSVADSSEYTFANFFCWRNCDNSLMTKMNGNLCVLAKDTEGNEYFYEPLGDNKIKETVDACAGYLMKKGAKPKFSRLTGRFLKIFQNDDRYLIEEDRDNFDYVYFTKDLIELKGKHFDGKRNRIKKFLKDHRSTSMQLLSKDIPSCLELLGRWKSSGKGLCIDDPIRQFLDNFDKLGLKGLTVAIEGRIEAFTIGEKLNNDTAVIYVEVANPKFTGISQFINQKFCEGWSAFKYIDREQDLGDSGLRRAKLSYHPCKLVKKYNMIVKG